ncbi:glycosyltransferase family 4 protein [Mucilaginibacter sp. Bleaf8]|uniref:glycosyltransferase family 4 protein n=1 Tax=Mucilaginibacter sp. Bleaf8 TaxID=2834430 RepID=UPI001BCC03D9|nr:glycosyltransferase family 4 protein [Mucilaginibacter sp. Bleaf8]MBS7566813.1 glycosyltransferase family 4 protein [Mucilaginibacter sp. Bleaf8]
MTDNAMPCVLYLTNIPAPYREKMHELLSECNQIKYTVVYCSEVEPNRQWKFKKGNYQMVYLSNKANRMIHNNLNVIRCLNKHKPDVVISTGFNPTMLYGFIWCLLMGKKFVPFTDGTFDSERTLSAVHRLVRRIIYKFSASFIGASAGSIKLYESYRVPKEKVFKSCLCIENHTFAQQSGRKKYDLMFAGQLIERKMPLFFAEVAKQVKDKLGKCNVLIVGDGPLRNNLVAHLIKQGIDFDYAGFVQPHSLPYYYSQSKLFLFPTLNDPWGVVANEACAAGLPVITCKNAGVAHDLIVHGSNGYVLPLDAETWVEHICDLLTAPAKLKSLSANAAKQVQDYNHQSSADGILASVKYALAS